ncbi:inhibitor of nuclear factor kappa-B kinase-interacting protein isoform X2 [Protopterus annectens]|uniref:inhibitor of nuclear factor kappa-B kinase-interacting protein isoform X2 n=1 Tax=Protopterus annectens TaxID=7888 RepID=UPI001CFA8E5C|nr:inhibitor of nuclear factor kappa-B kinase-interacting protein isoform X2 [Protopterus annectens]
MSNELKQRKKASLPGKQNEGTKEQTTSRKEDARSSELSAVSVESSRKGCSLLDPRNFLCFISLAATGVLTWLVLQQSTKFADVEEKYSVLLKETADVRGLSSEIDRIAKKCDNVRQSINHLHNSAIINQIEHLEDDLHKIKLWSDGISQKGEELQQNLTSLHSVVNRIEESTTSISNDFSLKISGIKTDIRRISGLESDVSALSESLHQLEVEVNKIDKRTIQNVGEFVASSIERITQLKSSVSRNSEIIDSLENKLVKWMSEHNRYEKKLLTLESSQTKILRAVTFANDMKPKIHNIKIDIAVLHPRLDDLTGRIGRLASELLGREKEIQELKNMIFNLTTLETEINGMKDQVNQVPEINKLFSKDKVPTT